MNVTARGGYQIIDFQGIEVGETPVIIPGIYEEAKGGLIKPAVLYNFVSDVSAYAPIYPELLIETTPETISIKFSSNGYNYTIVISNTDTVEFTEDE